MKELEGMLAEVEETRRWRLARQREGIAAAQDRGVSFGRPRKPVPENFEDVKALYQEGRISSREAAKMVGICQDTFLRWCRGR
ncbi:MAG: UPF0175 family protein [Oscillospiraceae bacterium]|nr:UPF0175 family protein [Oscillospiraceae bacterium]